MNNRIVIQNIKIAQCNSYIEVIYNILIRENKYCLTYKISGEDIEPVPLLCDTPVVSLLVYAVQYDLSFYSEYPISEKLYYNLIKHVIPQMSISNKSKANLIQINMPLSKEVFKGKWVGTGISMGVDSFATMHEYMEECSLEDYKLTHLVHLKTGAHHGQLGYFDQQKEDELFLAENTKVKKFCKEYGYRLIVIESNLYAVTCTEFGYGFDTTHTFRNLGCILLLQNLFCKYYYASTYNIDDFSLSLNYDSAHYEKWVMPYISNESVEFYSANTSMTRIEKTKFISKFDDTYNHLHVCWHEITNCGCCAKCIRTLVSLDILGVIEKYSNCFDLDYYHKNRDFLISNVILMRNRDPFYMDIYNYMLKSSFKMPSKIALAKASVKILHQKVKGPGLRNVFRVITRKLSRK